MLLVHDLFLVFNSREDISVRKALVIYLTVILFLLSGCASAEAVYDSVKSFEATDEELQLLVDGDLGFEMDGFSAESGEGGIKGYLKSLGYSICKTLSVSTKQYALWIIGISFLIGFIIIRFSPNAIGVRKVGWFVFIFGIPILTVILLFASAYGADALM